MASNTTQREWKPRAMCTAMDLDRPQTDEVLAMRAWDENPLNKPLLFDMRVKPQDVEKLQIAMTTRWWGPEKKKFTFGFMDSVTKATADKIQGFANRWSQAPSGLEFVWTNDVNGADFRIAFERDGYWSYVGVDCRSIPKNQATMNLQGMGVPSFNNSEGDRVIPHEFGHAIGFPHEHSRPEIIALLDEQKVIRVFKRDQGWSEADVRAQILTPIKASAIHSATEPDVKSIMCYWFTAECTKNGKPIVGGSVLSDLDKKFAAKTWPKDGPIEPPPPGVDQIDVQIVKDGKIYRGKIPLVTA